MRCCRLLISFFMLAIILYCTGCGRTAPDLVSAAPSRNSLPQASSAPANPAADGAVFTASGPIIVENQIDVTAQRDGMVTQILADTASRVSKGQLLALLDDRQLRSDRAAAQANLRATEANTNNWQAELKLAEADETRAEKMAQAELITKEQFEHAHFNRVAAGFQFDRERENQNHFHAAIHSIDLEIEKTRIVAPFSGVVARRYIRMGQKVAVNDRLFWVTSTGPLKVIFILPEEFLKSVHVGDKVQVSPVFDPNMQTTATISSISPVVDPASETIEVKAQLQADSGELRPGMATNIRIRKR